MNQPLLVLLLGILAIAYALAWLAHRTRLQTGLPNYSRIISTDTSQWRRMDKPLFSRRLWLTGKPDYVVVEDGETVPVEVKPNRVAREPYLSDTLQLMAYGQLVGEAYGAMPSHGLLKYRDELYRIEFTDELQSQFLDALDEMRASLDAENVDRNHEEPGRCSVCGFRGQCGQEIK